MHCVKSFRAYNVKSSSTLFLDNIQWNFEIYFPCARFNSLLGYNLITKSWDHQKWDFQTPISWNWKNTLSCEIYFFEKLYSESIEFETYQDGWKNEHLYLQTFETIVKAEINRVLHETCVEDCHLVARFKNAWTGRSKFEREGSRNFFRNRQISSETHETSSTCFWDPRAPLGPIVTRVSSQGPPQKWFSFRKCDERGWKSTLSTFLLKEVS